MPSKVSYPLPPGVPLTSSRSTSFREGSGPAGELGKQGGATVRTLTHPDPDVGMPLTSLSTHSSSTEHRFRVSAVPGRHKSSFFQTLTLYPHVAPPPAGRTSSLRRDPEAGTGASRRHRRGHFTLLSGRCVLSPDPLPTRRWWWTGPRRPRRFGPSSGPPSLGRDPRVSGLLYPNPPSLGHDPRVPGVLNPQPPSVGVGPVGSVPSP